MPDGCSDTTTPVDIGEAATGAVGTGPGIDCLAVEPVVRRTCVIGPAGNAAGGGTPGVLRRTRRSRPATAS